MPSHHHLPRERTGTTPSWYLGPSGPPKKRRPGGTNRATPTPMPMLICTRSETFVYDGMVDEVVAGRDRVRADHPIARRFPGSFRPLRASETRGATRAVVRARIPGTHLAVKDTTR